MGESFSQAREAFASKVAMEPYAPQDGRLEAAVAQLMERVVNKKCRVTISSSGHLGADGFGGMTVTVNCLGPTTLI